ncbi:MAG: RdgB/HAM1 family non-canonical purine NTP pyrophosphatase [Candidatus Cloacimonetes bacterium]|nr:RdgB/HAM1 family non-canonical purine NTP pyrophosphatase [Candidatus Cloacimonadota bacterium]
MEILIASRNEDKIREIRALISSLDVSILTPCDFDDLPEVVEDRDTLVGNALKKARVLSELTGLPTIADDTGLFIDALNGEPGVYSSRYAGDSCSYADNRRKVLHAMNGKDNRTARFITVAVFYIPGKEPLVSEGIVEGIITQQERGDKGFGYDSIFQITNLQKTYAEMEDEEKNLLSHRGLALRNLITKITQFLNSNNNK